MCRRDEIRHKEAVLDINALINAAQSFVRCQGIPAGIILRRSKSS